MVCVSAATLKGKICPSTFAGRKEHSSTIPVLSQNGEGTRPHGAADHANDRRRGHRVGRLFCCDCSQPVLAHSGGKPRSVMSAAGQRWGNRPAGLWIAEN